MASLLFSLVKKLTPTPPRALALAALFALHWLLALEERLTLWWQTGRWAVLDWAQAAVEWTVPGAPSWVPAPLAARRAPRRVGGGVGGGGGAAVSAGRGARPPPPTCAALVVAEVSPGAMPVERAASVVNWCAQAGITRLFAYDPTGFLKQHAAGLRAHLARAAVVQLGFDGPVVEAGAAEAGAPTTVAARTLRSVDTNAAGVGSGVSAAVAKPGAGGGSGGAPAPAPTTAPPAVHVHLLSASDAEETMAKAIAASAAAAATRVDGGRGGAAPAPSPGALPPPAAPAAAPDPAAAAATAAAVARLDAALASASGPAALAEPGIALVYGSAFTLAGYPPWALRSAEIYSMGPLTAADGRGVRGALARYGATHQRFGA